MEPVSAGIPVARDARDRNSGPLMDRDFHGLTIVFFTCEGSNEAGRAAAGRSWGRRRGGFSARDRSAHGRGPPRANRRSSSSWPAHANVACAGAVRPGPGRRRATRQHRYRAAVYVVDSNTGQAREVSLTRAGPMARSITNWTRNRELAADVHRVQHRRNSLSASQSFDLLAMIAQAVRVTSRPGTLLVLSSGLSTAGGFDLQPADHRGDGPAKRGTHAFEILPRRCVVERTLCPDQHAPPLHPQLRAPARQPRNHGPRAMIALMTKRLAQTLTSASSTVVQASSDLDRATILSLDFMKPQKKLAKRAADWTPIGLLRYHVPTSGSAVPSVQIHYKLKAFVCSRAFFI